MGKLQHLKEREELNEARDPMDHGFKMRPGMQSRPMSTILKQEMVGIDEAVLDVCCKAGQEAGLTHYVLRVWGDSIKLTLEADYARRSIDFFWWVGPPKSPYFSLSDTTHHWKPANRYIENIPIGDPRDPGEVMAALRKALAA